MREELTAALTAYQHDWQVVAETCHDPEFLTALPATNVAWKVAEQADFDRRFMALRELSTHAHLVWLDERWIATFYLKEALPWNIRLVMLMQRRPGSSDHLGLDHVGFMLPEGINADKALANEPQLAWAHEAGDYAKWISIRFNGMEAKLRTQTVLDSAIAELQEVRTKL